MKQGVVMRVTLPDIINLIKFMQKNNHGINFLFVFAKFLTTKT